MLTPPKHATSRRVETAIILAAGSGRRLLPLTNETPKCLVKVAGRPILARFLDQLERWGWKRVVIVTGHLGDQIDAYVRQRRGSLVIETVHCPDHAVTNNIVSLHTVHERVDGPVLVADGDLVLCPQALSLLTEPDAIAVDVFDSRKMSGSTVTAGPGDLVAEMQVGSAPKPSNRLFKTVNLTSLSGKAWKALGRRIEQRVRAGDVRSFYEAALADLIADDQVRMGLVHFVSQRWAEIDSADDLARAERLFGERPLERARTIAAARAAEAV